MSNISLKTKITLIVL